LVATIYHSNVEYDETDPQRNRQELKKHHETEHVFQIWNKPGEKINEIYPLQVITSCHVKSVTVENIHYFIQMDWGTFILFSRQIWKGCTEGVQWVGHLSTYWSVCWWWWMHSTRARYIVESKMVFESRSTLEFPGPSTCDCVHATSTSTSGPSALFTNEIFERKFSDVGVGFLCSKNIHLKEFLISYAL